LADKDWSIWFHKLKNDNSKKIDENAKPTSLITNPGDAAVYEGVNMYDIGEILIRRKMYASILTLC
jgi:hypothetical protein